MITARHNPFAVHRLEALAYRFDGFSWGELMSRLSAMQNQAAIIGPYGSGKTTLLEQLAARLSNANVTPELIFVSADRPVLSLRSLLHVRKAAADGRFFLIDGADLLPWWQWRVIRLFTRNRCGLLIAGHRSLGLPVLWRCRPSQRVFDDLLAELLQDFPNGDGIPVKDVWSQCGGNMREAFRRLYWLIADQRR